MEALIKKTKRNREYSTFLLPPLVMYSLFFVVPVLLGLCYSFTDWNGFSREIHFAGLANYKKLFLDKQLKTACVFTIKYTILLTLCSISIALSLALSVCSDIRFKKLFRLIFFFPACLSLVTVGLVFNEIFYQGLPQIGKTLGWEWLSSNILSSEKTAMYGILFVHIWKNAAIPFVLFVAGIEGISEDIYAPALIDGAGGWMRLKSITLPLLIPMITVASVLSIKEGLTVFDYIVVMTSGGPGGSTESLAFLIYNNSFKHMKLSYAVAQSVLVFALLCIISFIQFRINAKSQED